MAWIGSSYSCVRVGQEYVGKNVSIVVSGRGLYLLEMADRGWGLYAHHASETGEERHDMIHTLIESTPALR